MSYIIYWSLIVAAGVAFIAAADTKVMDGIIRKLFVRRGK